MNNIHKKKLAFNYSESKWEWISQLLDKENINEFVDNAELWGEVPSRHPDFKRLLKENIIALEKMY